MRTSRIIHKRSAVPGAVPDASKLKLGEIAINTHDGIAYTKYADGDQEVVTTISGVKASANNVFVKAQRGHVVTVFANEETVSLDLDDSNNFDVTIEATTTLEVTNAAPGQSGAIVIRQNSTGGNIITFGQNWVFPNRNIPITSQTPKAIDMVAYYVISPSEILVTTYYNIGH